MNFMIEYVDKEFVIGTNELAKKFKTPHVSMKKLIKKYRSDFEEVGESPVNIRIVSGSLNGRKSKTKSSIIGRPTEEYLLNEPQATYLIVLMRNQNIVRNFKKHLTKSFFKQRKMLATLLSQKTNADWLEKRRLGKIERRIETDTIKEFVEYSKSQGSKSSSKYYMAISKMQNKTLFNFDYITQKYPNIRDIAQGFQLDTLKMADRIVAKAIREGMDQLLSYKEIYAVCKERVEQFASILGKTPIQVTYENCKKKREEFLPLPKFPKP